MPASCTQVQNVFWADVSEKKIENVVAKVEKRLPTRMLLWLQNSLWEPVRCDVAWWPQRMQPLRRRFTLLRPSVNGSQFWWALVECLSQIPRYIAVSVRLGEVQPGQVKLSQGGMYIALLKYTQTDTQRDRPTHTHTPHTCARLVF